MLNAEAAVLALSIDTNKSATLGVHSRAFIRSLKHRGVGVQGRGAPRPVCARPVFTAFVPASS